MAVPLAFAQTPTPPGQEVAGKLCSIVDFVQYIAGAVGIVVLAVLGLQFVTVGSNPMRREELKTQMGLALMGLFIVLVSKSLVGLILPNAATC
jgi:hypothetical protein